MDVRAKNILITGKPRTGKTTLIKRLLEHIDSAGGFYTEEFTQHSIRQGFKIMTLDGKQGILARKGMPSHFRVGNYGVDIQDLEQIGVTAIEEAIRQEEVIVIDEIAKMELFSAKFKEAVLKALDSPKRVIAVIQLSNHPFLNQIRQRTDVKIYELTPHTRQFLMQTLIEELKS